MKKNNNLKPHIIITIGTHGDEKIGFYVKKQIEKIPIKKGVLEFVVGNPQAVENKKRYIDQDLNRSFPGKNNGNYEQKRAFELLPKIKKADLVIDIHSTTSQLRDAVIVTKLDKNTKRLLKVIKPLYVLHMFVTGDSPLIYNAKVGIAFEYGNDKNKETILKTVKDIKNILTHFNMIDQEKIKKANNKKTVYFKVVKSFPKQKAFILNKDIENYKLVKRGSVVAKNGQNKITAPEDFYPILFGQENYKDIFGFVGKKINCL